MKNSQFGSGGQPDVDTIISSLYPNTDSSIKVYSRLKSNNSIWKKISSIAALELMTKEEFNVQVNDYLALRWCIKPKETENRYDAVINAMQYLPQGNIIHIRNQFLAQSEGFSSEPIVKVLYQIQGYPVELQITGGHIWSYACAKGYANYKVGANLFKLQDSHTSAELAARLGMCLYFEESNNMDAFYQLMYMELIGARCLYDDKYRFNSPKEPILLM